MCVYMYVHMYDFVHILYMHTYMYLYVYMIYLNTSVYTCVHKISSTMLPIKLKEFILLCLGVQYTRYFSGYFLIYYEVNTLKTYI